MFSELRLWHILLGSSTRKFRGLVQSGDTLHPEGEYASDVTKAGVSTALLSLQEGKGI
jgi:hypothetical protein